MTPTELAQHAAKLATRALDQTRDWFELIQDPAERRRLQQDMEEIVVLLVLSCGSVVALAFILNLINIGILGNQTISHVSAKLGEPVVSAANHDPTLDGGISLPADLLESPFKPLVEVLPPNCTILEAEDGDTAREIFLRGVGITEEDIEGMTPHDKEVLNQQYKVFIELNFGEKNPNIVYIGQKFIIFLPEGYPDTCVTS